MGISSRVEHDELPAGIEDQARSYDMSPHFYDSIGGGATFREFLICWWSLRVPDVDAVMASAIMEDIAETQLQWFLTDNGWDVSEATDVRYDA
jgi:hypothetical protein